MDAKPGDIKAEVTGENKWVRMGMNGTVDAVLTVDRPCRISIGVDDFQIEVLVFEGLVPQDGEKPVATLGIDKGPQKNWISHQDGTLTVLPRKQEGE